MIGFGRSLENKDFLRGNSVLDALSEIESREVFSIGKIVALAADEPIYDYGDVVKHLYFPLDAVFSTTSLMEDGSSAEFNLTGNEGVAGVFAAFNEQVSRHWTSVLLKGDAVKVEVAALRSLIEESDELQAALLTVYRQTIAQISQRAVCNGRHSLSERLCFWLLLVHDRVRADEIALTHETIAKKLGARRAGITNVAGTLQNEEIISYSRGTIKILNRPKLEKNACECYQAIINNEQREA
jgi:CRP-like cAMP-binding protein